MVLMSSTRSVPSPAALLPGTDSLGAPVTVLGVSDDAPDTDGVTAHLDGADGIDVETVTTPTTAPAHLDAVDCVVVGDALSDEQLRELLATVRQREPTLPFVLVADDPSRDLVDRIGESPWNGHVAPGAGQQALLASRIRTLVGHRRTTTVARRALAALEQAADAIAIVTPDGTIEFANQLFARQLGTTAESVVGRDWRTLYPDSEVKRLESDAFPSLDDGWRWIGDCEMYREDGSTVVAQTRIDALDDESLVFTVSDRPADGD